MKGNCHTGNIPVIEEQGVIVYGGGTNRDGGWHTMDEVPDLALGPKGVMRSVHYNDVIPDGWKCANAFIAQQVPILIEIDWPDFSIPRRSSGWRSLMTSRRRASRPSPANAWVATVGLVSSWRY